MERLATWSRCEGVRVSNIEIFDEYEIVANSGGCTRFAAFHISSSMFFKTTWKCHLNEQVNKLDRKCKYIPFY
jgi:hypothetical protein